MPARRKRKGHHTGSVTQSGCGDADDSGILCFATEGHKHVTDQRIRALLEPLLPQGYPFDHDRKIRSAVGLVRTVLARRPTLIVMEGVGICGGVTLIAIRVLLGVPFVVSSGDAYGPFVRLYSPLLGLLGGLYERALCRTCAGYVGWTPYLVGRALTFGAPRGMTAPGWPRSDARSNAREAIRGRLNISKDALVVGLVGSLHWTKSVDYVYGAELIQAIRRVSTSDVVVCIVGDGSGLVRLRELAGEDLGARVVLTGGVPPSDVADYLAAFDVASLSQSVDAVGSFRYTTKLSEYLNAGLPIIVGEIPAAYDLDEGYFWRLPGRTPWSSDYIDGLVQLLDGLTVAEVADRRNVVLTREVEHFDKLAQQQRMSRFVRDILDEASQRM